MTLSATKHANIVRELVKADDTDAATPSTVDQSY